MNCLAEQRGHTLLWDKTKTWTLPGSRDVYVAYSVWDGRRGRMKIPSSALCAGNGDPRGEIYERHFPQMWQDPVL